MRILIATPAPPGSLVGNRRTALRYAALLRELGHRVRVATAWSGQPCDVLVALHARKSSPSIRAYRRATPGAPLIVVLTGTDLYQDLRRDSAARDSIARATRIVVLQPQALRELPPRARARARSILQSAEKSRSTRRAPRGCFQVCQVGHLRAVKDPFRAAEATELLPESSRIRVVHLGAALSPDMEVSARAMQAANPRYRWLGPIRPAQARAVLAGSHLFVQTSRMEGGSIALAEALVCGVPVLASRIPGAVGMLGERHRGLFPVGDTQALCELFQRAETDPRFRARLAADSRRLAPRFAPAREREAWRRLLSGIRPAILPRNRS